jgi:DNA-binding response OmpR family regulator
VRVLVVEDDPAISDLLERTLREELFHVDIVSDGQEAARLAGPEDYDAIILDLAIPSMDGFEVCRRLRERGVDTPILILTARDAVDDRVRALDAGGDDYMSKPFALAELLARVRAVTRRGRTSRLTAILSYGPVELDLRDHLARLHGKALSLTATEYRLLEFFLRRPEAIVTRQQLADSVWGATRSEESNVIDVYVSYLRKKLEPAGEPLIRTVRGLGYMMKRGRRV